MSFALPMMRGFPCPVTTPLMGAKDGPPQGIGCGWQNVAGLGPQFFITIHAEGGFAMIAQLDYARYQRFAENFAAIGRQALLKGDLEEVAPNDPFVALEEARKALADGVLWFEERSHHRAAQETKKDDEEANMHRTRANRLRDTLATVKAALSKEEYHG